MGTQRKGPCDASQNLEWGAWKPKGAQDRWRHQKLKEKHGGRLSLKSSEAAQPLPTSWSPFGLLVPGIVREYISVVLSHPACDTLWQPP